MPRGSATDFLRRLNEQNDRIAARKAEEKATQEAIGVDQFQVQRDQERREKWGRLRARPHSTKRPKHSSPVWDTLPDI